MCDSGDQLTCDAELSVTETVTGDEVERVIDSLRGMTGFNEGLVCDEEDGVSTVGSMMILWFFMVKLHLLQAFNFSTLSPEPIVH